MKEAKRIIVEAAGILVVGTLFGLCWNGSLLLAEWRGVPATEAHQEEPLPLPAPLPQVKELFDARQAVFVDARSPASFRKGHIPGAVSFPAEEGDGPFPAFRSAHGPETTLVVYCNGYGCPDSMEVGRRLLGKGYRNVLVFEGGIPEWHDAGYPVTAP